MTTLRRVEKLVGDHWIVVEMSELSKGDLFKLFEPDTGEQVGGVWSAKSDAYFTDEETSDEELLLYGIKGVWGIEADEHRNEND